MSNQFESAERATRPSGLKTILLAGFTAGTLDILGAITVYSFIMNRVTPTKLLQGIASSLFGSSAINGGYGMALAGLVIHYCIAFSFAIFFFFVFPFVPFLKNQRVLGGLLYGIFAWCVMNLAVLPLLHIANIPTKWDGIARGAIILMFCIGLPISLIVNNYYLKKQRVRQ